MNQPKSLPRLDGTPTKVVGVAIGDHAALRQKALATLKMCAPSERPRTLDLVPEPTNPYDPDALAVCCNVPTLGDVQLGYVRNSDTQCGFCEHWHVSYPKSQKCSRCGTSGQLRRNGLASQIARQMAAEPRLYFYGEIEEITGGEGYKDHLGLNYRLRAVLEDVEFDYPDPLTPQDP